MTIEKKEKYTLISSDENSFSDFYTSYIENISTLENNHLVLHISDKININNEDFLLFLNINKQKRKSKLSFVIVNNNISVDNFPDNFNIVPTLIEAEDILEMEAMERELGF